MTKYHYDSDDARNRSPSLEPTKVDYEPHESPVPFISDKSESPKGNSNSTRRDCKRPHRHRKDPNASLSARQILISLGANRPEILNDLIDRPHPSHASSESDESGGSSPVEQDVGQRDAPMSDADTVAVQALPEITAGKRGLDPVDPFISNQIKKTDYHADGRPQRGHIQSSVSRLDEVTGFRTQPVSNVPQLHPHHGPVLPRITTNYPAEERPMATSPSLRLYTISPSEHLARETLPALQSPPQSSSVNSPTTSLPPIKATFPEELSETRLKDRPVWLNGASQLPAATSSPSYSHSPLESGRRPPDHFLPPPLSVGNPYIQVISPASSQTLSAVSSAPSIAPSQQSPWHLSSRSERSFTVSPGNSSSQMSETPSAGYSSPNEPRHNVSIEQKLSEEQKPKSREPPGIGGFKCSFPGCTAAPFQTQYLLK